MNIEKIIEANTTAAIDKSKSYSAYTKTISRAVALAVLEEMEKWAKVNAQSDMESGCEHCGNMTEETGIGYNTALSDLISHLATLKKEITETKQ